MSDGTDSTLVAIIAAAAAFAGATLGGLVSLLTTERRIAMENVTQERAKWREEIRKNAEIASAAIRANDKAKQHEMRSKFAILLNPHDSEDAGILGTFDAAQPDPQAQTLEFTDRVSLLLKHDWERAKRETSLFRRLMYRESRRVTFDEFRRNPLAVEYIVRRWF